MTFLDKLKEDNPNLTEDETMRRVRHSCPYVYGYGGENVNSKCMNDGRVGSHCVECWNREMPNTEPKTEKPIYKEIDEDIALMDARKEAYNQGLNDAWELFKKMLEMPNDVICEHILEGDAFNPPLAMVNCLTPQEAIAKLKAYEEAQSKMKLGEIVIVNIPDEKGIVIVECQDGEYKVLMEDFDIVKLPASKLTKTGRFVALNNILEQIGGE